MKFRSPYKHFVKPAQQKHFSIATLLAILLQGTVYPQSLLDQRRRISSVFTLHGWAGERKYLNHAERRRFRDTLEHRPPEVRLFCLVLMWSGCRLSEALALTPAAIDLDSCLITLLTLKRRRKGMVRQVPLPAPLLGELEHSFDLRRRQRDPVLANERIWSWSRTTAWRHVKRAMEVAGVAGTPATPKGLRHAFGVAAFQAQVPPHLVQRWLGHASLRTTAIYADVSGYEERAFASRMWIRW